MPSETAVQHHEYYFTGKKKYLQLTPQSGFQGLALPGEAVAPKIKSRCTGIASPLSLSFGITLLLGIFNHSPDLLPFLRLILSLQDLDIAYCDCVTNALFSAFTYVRGSSAPLALPKHETLKIQESPIIST
ncbi:hypothetical protein B0H16DRAFT_1454796 [Mycena metata]|uniref:Uncharacterized protein n=1 Tax=Mycena metata TaxID=1033252 RepID=A0AAD7JGA6_9AGAR|nr:hypothetical protein B0H16DRAFT_1454796 [Mycena metata]